VSHTVKSRDYCVKQISNNVRRLEVEGEVGVIAKLITHNTGLTRWKDSAAEESETDKARQMKAKFMLKIMFQFSVYVCDPTGNENYEICVMYRSFNQH
jgi:hypothetical protein